ncbi:MAG TPA: hypothetical protein VME43_22825 [Bryobacteraceae bacterium]|nr:hypothetical protein [Bryobacteraceae bacterium]
MDARPDTRQRQLVVSGDGSYTNRTVLRQLPARTTFIGRTRKDAKLFLALPPAGATRSGGWPRRYGAPAPTPEEVLHDDAVPVTKVRCFAAGQVREIPVKVVRTVYWRKAGANLPLLLLVIQPLGYRLRKGSKLLYRQPAFLVCTDPHLELTILLQAYVDRWEIECNHRDEKSLIGTAQGQVWNPLAVVRLPQFQVAIYSLLLSASILAYGFQRTAVYLPLPLWRRKSIRPTARGRERTETPFGIGDPLHRRRLAYWFRLPANAEMANLQAPAQPEDRYLTAPASGNACSAYCAAVVDRH